LAPLSAVAQPSHSVANLALSGGAECETDCQQPQPVAGALAMLRATDLLRVGAYAEFAGREGGDRTRLTHKIGVELRLVPAKSEQWDGFVGVRVGGYSFPYGDQGCQYQGALTLGPVAGGHWWLSNHLHLGAMAGFHLTATTGGCTYDDVGGTAGANAEPPQDPGWAVMSAQGIVGYSFGE
jgi:hypothetical protein